LSRASGLLRPSCAFVTRVAEGDGLRANAPPASSPVGRPWGLNFDGTGFAGGVVAEAAEANASPNLPNLASHPVKVKDRKRRPNG
jgi:hypothetical protein